MKNFSLLILFIFYTGTNLVAQKKEKLAPITNPFTAAILFGGSLSQVNGDESQGYNKAGLYGGPRGVVRFNHKFHTIIELLYSQKGSKLSRNVAYTPGIEEFIKVNYMEIPVLAKIFTKAKSEGTYMELGMSYARMINFEIDQHDIDPLYIVDYTAITDRFNKNDLFAVIGCGIDFKEHYELGYRFSFSFLPFYHDKDYNPSNEQTLRAEPVFQLRNYMMTLFAAYRF